MSAAGGPIPLLVPAPDHRMMGVAALRAGWRVTFLLGISGLVYCGLFMTGGDRWIAGVVMVAALVDGLVIWRLVDHDRLAASRWLTPVLLGWNLAHTVAISTVALVDGGLPSPFVTMLFVSVAYAALTLPPRGLTTVAVVDGLALVVIGLVGGQSEQLVIYVPCALVLGALSATIARELHRRMRATEEAQLETIEKLARAVEFRDASTGGHIDRMAAYAELLARRMGLPESQCDLILRAGPLHDVGKIGVPDSILLKPGRLTAQERAVMERHAQAGHDLLAGSHSAILQLGALIALNHHERWDGQGYPNGIAGERIPIEARILSVADVFDAVTSDRVYRAAMPLGDAVDIIRAGRGTQFDPAVVDAFLGALDEISEVGGGRDPGAEGSKPPAGEDGPGGAEDKPGREPGPDRPVLA